MWTTKIIRINGLPFRVPIDELMDANPNRIGEICRAEEPANPHGAAICTLPENHDTSAESGTVHIAHNGTSDVIAVWGDEAKVTYNDIPD